MTEPCGGAFGSGAFGAWPFGSGADLHVDTAAQYSLAAVDVTFVGAPAAAGPYIPGDALNPASWTVTPVSVGAGVIRFVQYVIRLGVASFRLVLDGTLTPLVTYQVIAAVTLQDEFGMPIVPDLECRTAEFVTFSPARSGIPGAAGLDARNDLANPQYRFDAQGNLVGLGTLQLDDNGDLAVENGVRYLRKRIVRRLSTAAGEFFHLPQYGAGITQQGQRLARPTQLTRLAATAQDQIRQEADVQSARVTVSSPRPGMYVFEVLVRTVAGLKDEFSTTVTIGSGSNA